MGHIVNQFKNFFYTGKKKGEMMEKIVIRSCEICKSMKNQQLEQKLRKAFPNVDIQIKCQSYCGPGSRTPFVMIGDDIIEASSIELLIKEIRQYLE